jgi:hypothetical protein
MYFGDMIVYSPSCLQTQRKYKVLKSDWFELSKLIVMVNLDLLEGFTEIWPNIVTSNQHAFVSKIASKCVIERVLHKIRYNMHWSNTTLFQKELLYILFEIELCLTNVFYFYFAWALYTTGLLRISQLWLVKHLSSISTRIWNTRFWNVMQPYTLILKSLDLN